MTEIEIQRKRGGGPWPWLVGLLVLALVVWGIMELVDVDDEPAVATLETTEQITPMDLEPVEPMGEAVTVGSFQAWVRDSAAAMGQQHEFTREGLDRMIAALDGLVARDTAPEVQQRLETVREQQRLLRETEASSTEHAGQARQAFIAAVEVLETLQQRPQLAQADLQEHVQEARRAAESLHQDTPMLQQQPTVQQFFEHFGEALAAAERHYDG